jgi:hypothetical protein
LRVAPVDNRVSSTGGPRGRAYPATLTRMTPSSAVKVSSPAELISAVPYLLGFHPADSVAVVAFRGGAVLFAGRHDLPPPGVDEEEARAEAAHLALAVARQGAGGAVVIGYGEPARATPAVLRTAEALRRLGVEVVDALRVTGGRFWSYFCGGDDGCPEDGWPCPDEHSAIAAAATYAGQVALPDREALVAQIAAVTGEERDAMVAATARAQARLADLLDPDMNEAGFARLVRRAGRTAIRGAERRYRSGGRLLDDEVAWLGVVLVDLTARDYAWERTGEEEWRLALWTDVLRRVEPAYVPAPASLLSFAAWRSGLGSLARVAVERALSQDPEYRMALMLDEILAYGVSPAMVEGWPEMDRRDFDGAARAEVDGPTRSWAATGDHVARKRRQRPKRRPGRRSV